MVFRIMHIAFIMDGNRRWAKQNKLAFALGHENGAKTLEKVVEWCNQLGVNTVTAYALSTENYEKRPEKEISALLSLINYLLEKKADKLIKNQIKVKFIGHLDKLPDQIKNSLRDFEAKTENFKDKLLQVCLNYGGRQEILEAAKNLLENNKEVNQENFKEALGTSLEPDLVIRTGGQKRISNFLLWQSAYSEFYFSDSLWPKFTKEELEKALHFYRLQKRNFGV